MPPIEPHYPLHRIFSHFGFGLPVRQCPSRRLLLWRSFSSIRTTPLFESGKDRRPYVGRFQICQGYLATVDELLYFVLPS